jgi:hypothetical protein
MPAFPAHTPAAYKLVGAQYFVKASTSVFGGRADKASCPFFTESVTRKVAYTGLSQAQLFKTMVNAVGGAAQASLTGAVVLWCCGAVVLWCRREEEEGEGGEAELQSTCELEGVRLGEGGRRVGEAIPLPPLLRQRGGRRPRGRPPPLRHHQAVSPAGASMHRRLPLALLMAAPTPKLR